MKKRQGGARAPSLCAVYKHTVEEEKAVVKSFRFQSLCHCIPEIEKWMSPNFLQLNKNKTEVVVFGGGEAGGRRKGKISLPYLKGKA